MLIADTIIAAAWMTFLIYWLISAFSANKSRPGHHGPGGVIFRLLTVLSVLAAIQSRVSSPLTSPWNPHLYALGAVLTIAGIGLAIYARVHLGCNWGMPMTEREHPELITSGPYRLIRHPIYTGALLAILGTTLATTWLTLILFAILTAYFIYSARAEERVMLQEFPKAYADYQSKSKMLIPFIY